RVAMLEVDEQTKRYRPIGTFGAEMPSFVSRAVVADAVRRGLTLFQIGAVGRTTSSSLSNVDASSAICAAVRFSERGLRVLYADTKAIAAGPTAPPVPPFGWRHAFELQVFASHAASALEAIERRKR